MPLGRPMETVDERLVRAPVATMFELARKVEEWPSHLAALPLRAVSASGAPMEADWSRCRLIGRSISRWVGFGSTGRRGGSRRWRSMTKNPRSGSGTSGVLRKGWTSSGRFVRAAGGTHVRIVHVWDGPRGSGCWHVGGDVRHRPGVRARNRVAHSRRAGGCGRARGRHTGCETREQ